MDFWENLGRSDFHNGYPQKGFSKSCSEETRIAYLKGWDEAEKGK